MARIPRYEQGGLASSMVGTPGVNTAGASAYHAAAQGLDTVAGAFKSVATFEWEQEQKALRQKQAEQRAAAAHLKTLQYETQAGGTKAEFGTALNDMDNQKRQQYMWTTDGAAAAWTQDAQKLMDNKLDSITDPELKLMTQKALQGELGAKQQQFSDFLNSRIPHIGEANSQKIGDALRLSVNNPDLTPDEVLKTIADFKIDPLNLKTFENTYGPAAEAKMRGYQSDAAKNYLSLVANTGSLAKVKALINDKRFDSIIEGTDKEQFYSRQRTIAADEERAKQHQEQITQQTSSIDSLIRLSNASATGSIYDAPPAQIEQVINDPNTSPGLKARLAAQVGKAKQTQVLQTNDQAALKTFGTMVATVNKYHNAVLNRWGNMFDEKGKLKVHGDEMRKQFTLVQRDLDKYISTYQDVKNVEGAIRTPEARRTAKSYSLQVEKDLSFIKNYLARDPQSMKMKAAKDSFIGAIGAPEVKYSNAQQQQVYNFYYRQQMNEAWERLTNANQVPVTKEQAAMIRTRIQTHATKQAESKGFVNAR